MLIFFGYDDYEAPGETRNVHARFSFFLGLRSRLRYLRYDVFPVEIIKYLRKVARGKIEYKLYFGLGAKYIKTSFGV